MKDFVKTMLAVIAAFIVWGLLRLFFFLILLGSASLGGSTPSVPRSGAVLDIDLSQFAVGEQTQTDEIPSFSMSGISTGVPVVGIRDAVLALQEAAQDPAVRFVYLRTDGVSAGMAHLEEFRGALEAFRASGKPVLAYVEAPGNGSYYLASAADKVLMANVHGSTYQLLGLSSTQYFLKDILDKLGVNVQLIRHGKYKSAGEMYIRNSASPENREQLQVMVNSLWGVMSEKMAAARDLSPEEFNALIDNLSLLLPEDFLRHGLVDELVDRQELVAKLCTLAQVDNEKKLHLVSFQDYVSAKVVPETGRNQVAVIYAEGEIVEGDDVSNIAGDRFARIIEKVRKDQNVKAVVLRVDSPGGSVSASEKIRASLDALMKEKPLVASYGDYAASGGYWISNGCQKIYADATTITGSIGVFSMIPEFSKVTKKVGVGVESVSSNKHSDMYSLMRPFDTQELAYMQGSVEDIYDRFVNLVATSRGLTPERVDEIAQGRVWAATDALEIGLVDEIGTLEDAIRYAAALADFTSSDEYAVVGYPAPLSFMEQLMQEFGSAEPEIGINKFLNYQPGKFYARLPYELELSF